MARLERLREQVADQGIIPRKEGATGLPSALYYLKVKELAALLIDPQLAPGYVEMARLRSKKRRRKKYLKEKAVEEQYGGGGHSNRLHTVLKGTGILCLGWFLSSERFISETGFSKAKRGYVYQVEQDRRILLTEDEAERAWVDLGIKVASHLQYRGSDLQALIGASEDRIYPDVGAE